MDDEEAFFEVWWALYRRDRWKKTRPDLGETPSPDFLMGYRDMALVGWLGRATMHVTYARSGDEKHG